MKAESFEHYYNSGYLLLFTFSVAQMEHPRRSDLLRYLSSLGVCVAGAGSVFVRDSIPLLELQTRLDEFLPEEQGVMVIPLTGKQLPAYFLSQPKVGIGAEHQEWIESYRQMTPAERSNRFTGGT